MRLRKSVLDREPFCRACARKGETVKATYVDHIVNKACGGTDNPSNLQPICKKCHDEKTGRESQTARLKVKRGW